MKLTDFLTNNLGSDKLLHCAIFGWAVALASLFGFYVSLGVFFALLILSIIKENKLDSFRDKKDTLFGCIGGGISLIISFILFLLK